MFKLLICNPSLRFWATTVTIGKIPIDARLRLDMRQYEIHRFNSFKNHQACNSSSYKKTWCEVYQWSDLWGDMCVLKILLDNVICDAITYTKHARRKVVTVMDVVYALKRHGKILYSWKIPYFLRFFMNKLGIFGGSYSLFSLLNVKERALKGFSEELKVIWNWD